MKLSLFILCFFIGAANYAQTPREVVQNQLEAYNAKDINAFLQVFDDDAVAYNYGEPDPFIEGKSRFREVYGTLFHSSPDLHSKVISRQVIGNTVIDYEYITGREGSDEPLLLMAIYVVEKGKIVRCDFIRE